jgi:hypothetical protein
VVHGVRWGYVRARIGLLALVVACRGRHDDVRSTALASASSSVEASIDAGPPTEEERFTAYLHDFCATSALHADDATWVRANVRLPLPIHERVEPEKCNLGPCRWRSRTAASMKQAEDRVCCLACELSSEYLAEYPTSFPPRIRAVGNGWVAFDGVGQFGAWLFFDSTHDGWRLSRVDEAE